MDYEPSSQHTTPLSHADLRNPPSQRLRAWAVALVVFTAMAAMLGLVAALALPMLHRAKNEQKRLIEERLEAVKLKGKPTAAQQEAMLAFGKQLAQALTAADSTSVSALVDSEALADRMFAPISALRNIREARQRFIQGTGKVSGSVLSALLGRQTKCLRVTSRAGFPAVLLRVLDERNSVTYFDVMVTFHGTEVKAVDFFNHMYASYGSSMGREVMEYTLLKDEDPAELALLQDEKRDPARLKALSLLSTELRLGRVDLIISQFQELSPAFQREPIFFQIYLQAMLSLTNPTPEGTKLYRQAIAAAPAIFGKESTTELLLVDLQMVDGDFAGAEKNLLSTEAKIGREAYLTTLQALMLLKQHKVAEAEHLRSEAVAMEPDLDKLNDLTWMIHAEKKEYAALVEDLKAYKTARSKTITRADLAEQPEYEGFLDSPEFAQWEKDNP